MPVMNKPSAEKNREPYLSDNHPLIGPYFAYAAESGVR